ncbi:MAG: hypothetical protein D6766_02230, partial [Verrucomicrobia bacterium]
MKPPRRIEYVALPPRPAGPESSRSKRSLAAASPEEEQGVCAQVRLRIEQEAVLTRKAVGATLELDNNSLDTPLENIEVSLAIYDDQGRLANDRFVILPAELTRFERVAGPDGDIARLRHETWRLAPQTTGKARWVILPKDEAAPDGPRVYQVGGYFNYSAGSSGSGVTLVPAPVTVYPNPRLVLDYFHQRDVLGDDPFTPQIEPSVPYTLAVMARNIGAGVAKNFSIISAQPQIVDNEKGLLIDFQIIGSEVAGEPVAPTLAVNFGDLQPGEVKTARWLLISSLTGFFRDYEASFEHESRFGGRETCPIDSVQIHELIHLVQAPGAFEDGKPDFLVNDEDDPEHLPDILYLSDGSTAPVQAVSQGTFTGEVGSGSRFVQLSVDMPAGWAYLRLPNPGGDEFRLVRAQRADGIELTVGTNVWSTDRVFPGPGQRPIRKPLLHLLDYDSPGLYTLEFAPKPPADTNAPQSAVAALPEHSAPSFEVRWEGDDGESGSGVAYFDIFVSTNGGPFEPWLERTRLRSAMFEGRLGETYAFYSVAVDAAGNREPPPAEPDAFTAAVAENHPPEFPPLTELAVNEGETLRAELTAVDPDLPAQRLSWTLGPDAPAGIALDPQTGLLTWSTDETDGPSTNRFHVTVSDNGTPPGTATGVVQVTVREVNQPPRLELPQAMYVVHEGWTLAVTNRAADPDWPSQRLSFSLIGAPPAGAAIDPETGVFTWKPTPYQGPSTNQITIQVTDDGDPPLSSSDSFTVIVRDTLSDFELGIGSTNLLAGENNAVAISLKCGLPLTNVTCALATDTMRLTNLALRPLAQEIQSLLFHPAGTNSFLISMALDPALIPANDHALAELSFEAPADAPSGKAPLRLTNIIGRKFDGELVANVRDAVGRVIVVNREPVLEARAGTNLVLAVFGRPGTVYAIQSRTD